MKKFIQNIIVFYLFCVHVFSSHCFLIVYNIAMSKSSIFTQNVDYSTIFITIVTCVGGEKHISETHRKQLNAPTFYATI